MHEQSPTATAGVANRSPLDELLLKLGVLTVLQSRVAEAVDAARSEVLKTTRKGDTLTIAHPDGDEEIAKVTHSKPKPKAVVTDVRALDAWVLANYPGKAETFTKVIGSQADVLDVLREHAPFLLEEVTEVRDWTRNELTKKSATAGEPVGFGGELGEDAPPGIDVSFPDGVLRVLVAANAPEVVDQLWLDHRVDMDGNLLELPAGGVK